jgi:predicted nucleic acid-binding protein
LYEVVNALYRSAKAGLLTYQAAGRAFRTVLLMPIKLHGDPELHRQALQGAMAHELSAAYDAHYLALAERLGVELWTADAKLVRAVEGRLAWVRLVS